MKIDSKQFKWALIEYFKYDRGFDLIATEVLNCDVMAVSKKEVIDIEIKISKSDFLADFKKHKHYKYNQLLKDSAYSWNNCGPNKFYFAVIPELVDFVVDFIKANTTEYECVSKYGVISFNESGQLYVAKNANILQPKFSEFLKREVYKSVMTEYMRMTDTYKSVTKDQLKHKRVYDLAEVYISRQRGCKGCGLYHKGCGRALNSAGFCELNLHDVKEGKDFKTNCKFLFKETSVDE